jgi:hypothetical protein
MALNIKSEEKTTTRQRAFIMSHQGGKRTDASILGINPRDAVLIAAVRSGAPLRDVMAALSRVDEGACFTRIV